MASYRSGQLSLYCNKCNTLLATSDILMLASIPPTQTHIAVRNEHEETAYEKVRKIPNPDPKRAGFSPYRTLCKQCGDVIGTVSIIEEATLICFKTEKIHFRRGYEQIKGKKLKQIKDKIIQYGLEVVNVSQLSGTISRAVTHTRTPAQPLVYCDVNLSTEEILSLTKDAPRGYQRELFLQAIRRNTLVYLPTGSGKTLIAAMVLSCMKKLNPDKLMVFLVDRIPLVYQQSEYVKSQVPDLRVEILAGDIGRFPGDKSRWIATIQALSENKIDLLVMTSQILINLMADECPVLRMSDISVLVFDEAHHCFGNHSYNQIMRDYYKTTSNRFKPLVLALTASPAGADKLETTQTKIEELLSNLSACARMPLRSGDLELYWNRPQTSYHVVPLNGKQQLLQSSVVSYVESLTKMIEDEAGSPRALDRLSILTPSYRGAMRKLMERCHGDQSRVRGLALGEHAMHMLSVIEINNILGNEYAVDCIEDCIRQMQTATSPMEKLKKKLIGSLNQLKTLELSIKDLKRISSLFTFSDRYQYLVKELQNFIRKVQEDETSRAIVFVKMRKTAYKLGERIRQEARILAHLNPAFLVGHGQASDGMDWRGEQEEVLKKFRSGEVKVLVSTSVLEEGLDVPVCNLVVRFDSALTLRALVQSRGRASRRPDSKFVVICSDAKEQTDAFDAIKKEKNMEQAMRIQQLWNSSSSPLQGESFGCHLKKPDFSPPAEPVEAPYQDQPLEQEPTAEDEDMGIEYRNSPMTIHERGESLASGGPRKRKKKYIPNVTVSIHNVIIGRENKEIGFLTEFFEAHFEVKSLKSERIEAAVAVAKDEACDRSLTSGVLRLNLEPLENQDFRSKEKFFTHIAESWCSRSKKLRNQTEKLWLRRADAVRNHKRKPVLVIKPDTMVLGYFINQASFCVHWPFNPRFENIRVAFEHDLRTMLVCFTVPNRLTQWKVDLYKLQIRYSELHEFVLVDKAKSSSFHQIYVKLRHPPRMFKAKSFIKKDQVDDGEENDFEEWYFEDEDYDFDDDPDRHLSDESASSSEDERGNIGIEASQEDEKPDNAALLTSSDIASIDEVVNWERVTEIEDSGDAFGLCCTYNFTFKASEWDEVKEVLRTIAKYDKKVFFASMQKSARRLPVVNFPEELPFSVKYTAQCLLHSFPFIRGRLTHDFNTMLGSKPEKVVLFALEKLAAALQRNSFCDPEGAFKRLLDKKDFKAGGMLKQLIPSQCALIKRMVITPTRLLLYTPEVMSKNRVLRNYNTDQFLCVNIRDEDFSRLSSAGGSIEKILERVKQTLDSGVIAGGDWFYYLGSSNSQLRNHGCWFVRPSPHPEEIRQWMGDFSKIR